MLRGSKPLVAALLIVSLLAGCAGRYDIQLSLAPGAQSQRVEARAKRDGWLRVIFRRLDGPWVETDHAFAVGRGDALSLERQEQRLLVAAGGQELLLDELSAAQDTVALAFRRTSSGPWAPLAELGLTTIQVVAISAAVVAASALLLVLWLESEEDEDDGFHEHN